MTRRTGKRAARDARPAGALVDELLARCGVAGAVREHRLVTCWEEIVGDRVAARAWPDGLTAGVLWVRAANSAWMHELSFLRAQIAERANAVCGDPPLVREVRFHVGRRAGEAEDDAEDVVAALARKRRARRRPAPAPRPPAGAAALARIDAETARVEDEELRATIRALRRRLGL